MQRYFGQVVGGIAQLSASDEHHLVDVVRIREKEKIEVVDGESVYLAQVEAIKPLKLRILQEIIDKREPDNPLLLAFALLKGGHNDLIVEKGTELGIAEFLPFLAYRSIVKVAPGEEDGRLQRLKKIALSSAGQCRRQIIPAVDSYKNFDDILAVPAEHRLLAYEGDAGEAVTISTCLSGIKPRERVILVVGPEGGFSSQEIQKARDAGFTFVSLGRRILRAETAAIAGAVLMSNCSEAQK